MCVCACVRVRVSVRVCEVECECVCVLRSFLVLVTLCAWLFVCVFVGVCTRSGLANSDQATCFDLCVM